MTNPVCSQKNPDPFSNFLNDPSVLLKWLVISTWMDGLMDDWMDGWISGQMIGWLDGQTGERMNRCYMDTRLKGRMNG